MTLSKRRCSRSLSVSQYEFFPPTKYCLNTVMARLSDLLHKNHTVAIAG
ncbi:hypothetical protein [Nostoc sp.]